MPKTNKMQKIIYLRGLETGFDTHQLIDEGVRGLQSVEKMISAVAHDLLAGRERGANDGAYFGI